MKRGRARRRRNARSRPRAHDLRNQYDTPRVLATIVDDPYGVSEPVLRPPPPGSGHVPGEHREWEVARAQLVLFQSNRDDALGRMRSRHQIDHACFAVGRDYQFIAERAHLRSLRSLDVSKPVVDASHAPQGPTDGQLNALRRLRQLDGSIILWHGMAALFFTCDVLVGGLDIKGAARSRGDPSSHDVKFWACTFRRVLDLLAVELGHVSRGARQSPPLANRWTAMAATVAARALRSKTMRPRWCERLHRLLEDAAPGFVLRRRRARDALTGEQGDRILASRRAPVPDAAKGEWISRERPAAGLGRRRSSAKI